MQVLTYNIKAYTANSTTTLQARVKCICSITHSCITSYQKLSRILRAIALTWLLALTPQLAHADFRKALDAYIARDGDSMLKEVKDAVEKKNDDGLMLFLQSTANIDYDTKFKKKLLLTKAQRSGLKKLLLIASQNSSADSEYFLFTRTSFATELQNQFFYHQHTPASPLNEEQRTAIWKELKTHYIERGGKLAMLGSSDLLLAAEAGDPLSQVKLAYKFYGIKKNEDSWGCEPPCEIQNKTQGLFWLKRAIKTYDEGYMNENILTRVAFLAERIAPSKKEGLRQSMLWLVLRDRAMGQVTGKSLDHSKIGDLYSKGVLKQIEPKLDAMWQDKEKVARYLSQLPAPDLLAEVRTENLTNPAPLLSLLFKENEANGYIINLYSNGTVDYYSAFPLTKFEPVLTRPDYVFKSTSETIAQLMAELEQMEFYQWQYPQNQQDDTCELQCDHTSMQVTARSKGIVKRLSYLVPTYAFDGKRREVRDNELNEQRVQMAKLRMLVEKYFPTNKWRCAHALSSYDYDACVAGQKNWQSLAEERNK